jgi:4-hydroxybenzoate polyprenyltransferase
MLFHDNADTFYGHITAMETELRDRPCPVCGIISAAVSGETRPCNTRSAAGGWKLIRPPNLFTVPGDVLAGAALAGFEASRLPQVLMTVAVSLLLYVSGLILNDYADRGRDARERPQRPIPSGRVDARSAGGVALLLLAVAIVLGWLVGPRVMITATLVAALVLAYNGPARRVPWLGFAVMGLCRGGNVYLGAAAVDRLAALPVAVGAVTAAAYIAGVTTLAYTEAQGPDAKAKQKRIGQLIRGLIVLQAAYVAVSAFTTRRGSRWQ